ncbi:MAG TPA: BamA/TamA family outer membrane protein [Gemmatimonadaceae bacterium]|nr:BamA/TamA family outer membrane protein [Gemmatimonadaceae bacterium]
MERPEVEDVEFSGVESVDEEELRDGLATQASGCRSVLLYPFCLVSDHRWFVEKSFLDYNEFQRDVLRIRVFYWRRGYREAQVDTSVVPDDDAVIIRFAVTEGRPTLVSSITVTQEGTRVLEDGTIEDLMQLRAGRPLDLIALDSSLVLLREELFRRGYSDAEIGTDTILVDDEGYAAAVRVSIAPRWQSRVGQITVRGLQHVSARTVRRSLELDSGDLFTRNGLLASQRALYESGLFRQAAIAVVADESTPDSIKPLQVTVREAPLRAVQLSGGFNTVDFIQVEQRFTKYDFLGGGRRLDARVAVGNLLAPQLNGVFPFHDVTPTSLGDDEEDRFLRPNWRVSLEFTQPWLFSPRNAFAAAGFAHRRSAPGIYIDRGYGASVTLTRRLAHRAPVSLSYRVEVTEVEAGDVYFCQSFGVCEVATIQALRQRQRLAPVSLSYFTDRSNEIFFPTRGYVARADAEHASAFTLSNYRYNRVSGEYARYFSVGRSAIAARVRGGWVRNLVSTAEALGVTRGPAEAILHPRKRFYAGGSQSVRGYGENQLGPRVLTVSPDALMEPRVVAGDTIAGCSAADIVSRTCDPTGVPADRFQPRPIGGTALIEASVEYRFPLWEEFYGAIFLDGALVGEGAIQNVTRGAGALTPGAGIRYATPAGVIRVDLGIRPTLVERLPVVTEIPADSTQAARIVRLDDRFRYDPLEGSRSGIRQVLNRLQLHLSIGQAF